MAISGTWVLRFFSFDRSAFEFSCFQSLRVPWNALWGKNSMCMIIMIMIPVASLKQKKGILASCGPAGRQSSVKAHNGVIDKVLDYDKDPIVGSLEVVMNMYKPQYIITKSSQISPTLGTAKHLVSIIH